MESASEFDLKSIRKAIGWRQWELAALLAVDRSTLSQVETGRRKLGGPGRKLVELLRDLDARGDLPPEFVPLRRCVPATVASPPAVRSTIRKRRGAADLSAESKSCV